MNAPPTAHVHRLKTWPDLFRRIADGTKTFDLRKDDRGFQNGDLVDLVEYDPTRAHECADLNCDENRLTGAVMRMRIGFVAKGTFFGLNLGEYAILSLLPVDATPPGAGRRLFNPGDPEPDESVLAVRYVEAVSGWLWCRSGVVRNGVTEWNGRGPGGDTATRRWTDLSRMGQVADCTDEVER